MAADFRKGLRHVVIVLSVVAVPAFLFGVQYGGSRPLLNNRVAITETLVYARWRNDTTHTIQNVSNGTSSIPKSTVRSGAADDRVKTESKTPAKSNKRQRLWDIGDGDFPDTREHVEGKRLLGFEDPARTTEAPLPLDAPARCDLLFKGNKAEIARVQRKLGVDRYHVTTDYEILRDTQDCQSYVASRGYITTSLSQEEDDFPLAFTIRMHYRVAQAERILRAIYRPQNVYCIHVDSKANPTIRKAMLGIINCLPNVFLASKLEHFVYTSFSPVEADLRCMQDLVNISVPWKYLLNVAGTEFPLKTNLEMVRILKALNGSNDIEQYTYPSFYTSRIKYKYKVRDTTLVNTYVKKEPFSYGNVTVVKGCSYNSYTRGFVEWVLTDDVAQRFINWTKDMHSPDEVVWGSLNSVPGAPGGYSEMITQISRTFLSRAIIWYSSRVYCHGQFVRGICILTAGELKWLHGRWEMFANKFDEMADHYALDCLEREIRNRTLHPDPDHSVKWFGVYRAPHVKGKPPPTISLSFI